MKGKQLVSAEDAEEAPRYKGTGVVKQHTQPCGDCPWSRQALNGWLGGASIDDWLREARANVMIPCHTLIGAQCAGAAIYRRNSCKHVDPPLLRLPADQERVFSNHMEFRAHHSKPPSHGGQR